MNVILQPHQFRRLESLRLNPRKSLQGRIRGERLTRKKGISIEFADYREYSEGDDLRHLDWNVLARLDTPVMRTYQDEEDLALHLLVDFSPSMGFGNPTKSEVASPLAALFAYVALVGGDSVLPVALGARQHRHRALRGRVGFPTVARWLTTARNLAENGDSLSKSLRAFAASDARPGIVLLLSDGMDPDAPGALRTLAGRGHEVLFLQILSDVELDPDLEGDLRLIDAEGGNPVEITANQSVIRQYRERLQAHNDALGESARRGGGRHLLVRSSQTWESVLDEVRRQGWLTSGGSQ